MRLVGFGSRDWTDGARVRAELALLFPRGVGDDDVLMHGDARGADALLEIAMQALFGRFGLRFPVDETLDGPWPAAGPRRSARMVRVGKPDQGVGFGPLWVETLQAKHGTVFHGGKAWKLTGTGYTMSLLLPSPSSHLPGFEEVAGRANKVRWVPSARAPAVDLAEMPPPSATSAVGWA